MAKRTDSQPIDLQELLAEAVKLELKVVDAGIEYWQLYMTQAAKLSHIANSTIEAVQEKKASVPEAAQRLTKFGKENADAFTSLAGRLGDRYFTELGRLADTFRTNRTKPARVRVQAVRAKPARKRQRQAKAA